MLSTSRAPRLVPVLLLAIVVCPGARAASAAPPLRVYFAGRPVTALALEPIKNPKLSSHLVRLAASERSSRASGHAITTADLSGLPPDLRSMVDSGLMRIDATGMVQIYMSPSSGLDALEALVRQMGGRLERSNTAAHLVQAWLPLLALEEIAAEPATRYVRLPDYGIPQTGSVTTAGDAIMRANLVRSTFGVDGTGVRVGVISDGVAGMAASQASGDLPPAVNTSTCNIAGGDPGSPGQAEGTAMLEIVHDLAPGAELWFGHSVTSLDFMAAVTCLAANTDVVVDDISFFNVGPYDGTSSISANTSAQLAVASHPIRGYATSVGNQAQEHYDEQFVDSGFVLTSGPTTWRVHRFAATPNTTDAGGGQFCSGSSGPFCGDTVRLAAGATIEVLLEWDDPFGASTNDYDLFLYDVTAGTIVTQSTSPQTGSQDPTESLAWTNTHATGLFEVYIGLRSGAAKRLHLFIPSCSEGGCVPFPNGTDHNFNTLGHSVPSESDAGGGVLSVGAIDAADPGHMDIESFSGRGPTADGRTKPDITGIDGVAVTGAGGFVSTFFGTSAAAPHVAGIMALLLQLRPDLKAGGSADPATARSVLIQALLSSAVHLGAGGSNDTFGAGRADAFAAAESLETGSSSCNPGLTTLCIDDQPGDRRFEIRVHFSSPARHLDGDGSATSLNSLGITQGGVFAFFSETNPEMLIKVLNACGFGGHYWVFFAAVTDVGFTVTVRDTVTGAVKTYSNADEHAASPVQDTGAFAC